MWVRQWRLLLRPQPQSIQCHRLDSTKHFSQMKQQLMLIWALSMQRKVYLMQHQRMVSVYTIQFSWFSYQFLVFLPPLLSVCCCICASFTFTFHFLDSQRTSTFVISAWIQLQRHKRLTVKWNQRPKPHWMHWQSHRRWHKCSSVHQLIRKIYLRIIWMKNINQKHFIVVPKSFNCHVKRTMHFTFVQCSMNKQQRPNRRQLHQIKCFIVVRVSDKLLNCQQMIATIRSVSMKHCNCQSNALFVVSKWKRQPRQQCKRQAVNDVVPKCIRNIIDGDENGIVAQPFRIVQTKWRQLLQLHHQFTAFRLTLMSMHQIIIIIVITIIIIMHAILILPINQLLPNLWINLWDCQPTETRWNQLFHRSNIWAVNDNRLRQISKAIVDHDSFVQLFDCGRYCVASVDAVQAKRAPEIPVKMNIPTPSHQLHRLKSIKFDRWHSPKRWFNRNRLHRRCSQRRLSLIRQPMSSSPKMDFRCHHSFHHRHDERFQRRLRLKSTITMKHLFLRPHHRQREKHSHVTLQFRPWIDDDEKQFYEIEVQHFRRSTSLAIRIQRHRNRFDTMAAALAAIVFPIRLRQTHNDQQSRRRQLNDKWIETSSKPESSKAIKNNCERKRTTKNTNQFQFYSVKSNDKWNNFD